MKRSLLWGIGVYQRVSGGRVSACRFIPSCSAFAAEAIEVHGVGRGTAYAVSRVCRCHPWGRSGFDPVPRRVNSAS